MQQGIYNSYWTRTETYETLKVYIDMDLDGLQEAVVQMIGGAHIPIKTGMFQNDMAVITCRDDVLTLLAHLGYLAYAMESKTVFVPNEEIRQEFLRAVKSGRHTGIANLVWNSNRLLRDTLDMNAEKVAAAIEEAHSAWIWKRYPSGGHQL